MKRAPGLALTAVIAACGGGGGGGGGDGGGSGGGPDTNPPLTAANLAVLYATGDATSEAIARAYQQARGIPDANVLGVTIDTARDAISETDFATMKTALDARLGANIQATLVTWSRPSRVTGLSCSMGLTSALAFGYSSTYCSNACGVTATSPLFNHDTHQPWTQLRVRPSMMLGAPTLAQAQTLIARGVAADASFLTGTTGHAWLVRTSDTFRSVRWPDLVQLSGQGVAGITMHYVDNSSGTGSNFITGQSGVMFYFTGVDIVEGLSSNQYRPGAVTDSLTSSAGMLPDGNGQTPITAWLQAGATASFGTVEEPCNYTEKFPQATVLVSRYARGDTLIEAYWKSVQRPGQGLFVGEPLARPWGR